MTQAHKDPVPVAGLHLAKTTSQAEDSLASDGVDILRRVCRVSDNEHGSRALNAALARGGK